MFCKSCGEALADAAVVCPKCGVPTGVNAAPVVPAAAEKSWIPGLVFSIVTFLCCCQPLGIASIVMSVIAHSKQKDGKAEDAAKFAKYALICNIVGVALGLIVTIVYAIICVAAAAAD